MSVNNAWVGPEISDGSAGYTGAFDLSQGTSSEQPLFPAAEESYHARSYWYGKVFFQCVVAETVFRNAEKFTNGTSIDADCATALHDYPIGECLAKITDHGKADIPVNLDRIDGDQYSKLMTIIGATILHGDGKTKRSLAASIHSSMSKSLPVLDHWDFLPPSPPETVTEVDKKPARPEQPRQAVKLEALHAYTAKLYEWGKQHRIPLKWDARMISEYNDWEHSVSFQGMEFKDEAQLKQDAKHKASKKACEYLGI